ncbi:uncharacterized protein PFL1_00799 [Pseudozyma flocculosa PF-1]|uniref:Related to splicing factor U2AF 35 kd subunit n=1 Tax=Pseudozyma flocculosa TaxID=84751 RepID=A0A5C3F2L5_9BASI|nr:uncharacterized protein PFL1_00799 [Pseudozyma flocculosa PF-1]EPQ31464.1 hypothetical protein PFL1_00799 [Pseudozyma flocculosa PF-1]SPO38753.1 related to splicing factor U2AF 35 kd subunit [Pseudozyma flocculosa]
MASYLASIYGTEQDKVNCSFYYKIGACRHGPRCSRKHTKPPFSQTILISNVYRNPLHDPSIPDEVKAAKSRDELQRGFDEFFTDWFVELARYGKLVEMHVCDNVGDHLIGNVYARYEWEEEAQRAVDALNQRWYDGRPLFAELSPVTDFREACCRQNETDECNRGGFCNFMHLRYASPPLVRELHHQLSVENRKKRQEEKLSKLGWKDRLKMQEEVEGDLVVEGGGDWRKAQSGGDWRSSNRGGEGDGEGEGNSGTGGGGNWRTDGPDEAGQAGGAGDGGPTATQDRDTGDAGTTA